MSIFHVSVFIIFSFFSILLVTTVTVIVVVDSSILYVSELHLVHTKWKIYASATCKHQSVGFVKTVGLKTFISVTALPISILFCVFVKVQNFHEYFEFLFVSCNAKTIPQMLWY